MKAIFLDFDGVLITHRSFREPLKVPGKPADADPLCIAALNEILIATGALIVVSSTHGLEGRMPCREKLYGWGVKGRTVLDITPRLFFKKHDKVVGYHNASAPRGLEIQNWMDTYEREEIESFVILDDDSDMEHLGRYLIQTEFENGLTMAHALRAIEMLNRKGA